MPTLSRLFGAVFAVPLLISKPILRFFEARKRRSGAFRARPPSRPFADTQTEVAARIKPPSAAEIRAMRDEIRRVLDEDETHRQVFRHLARFERKFAKSGLSAIESVPVDQLRRALKDFEALVRNWSSVSLADLRSRMAVTLTERSSAASVWIAANSVSSVFRPRPETMAARLARSAGGAFRPSQQKEAGTSRFEAAGGEWPSTSTPA
jgi:hypothetical protein